MNKNLFNTLPKAPITNTVNEAGGKAYQRSSQEALAQHALTGCLGNTFYVKAETQLQTTLQLIGQCSPEFVAKLAVYARTKGYMKDMPATLLAAISTPDNTELVKRVFERVINNGKMLRNYVQVLRSGVTGRKSLGSAYRNLVRGWIYECSAEELIAASVGNTPSLADIIKMVHPKPTDRSVSALLAYILGKASPEDWQVMPSIVQQLENFRKDPMYQIPVLATFELLTSTPLTTQHWIAIAQNAGWQMLRMNLNTFLRNGVFKHPEATEMITAKLKDYTAAKRARIMPYQALTSYLFVDKEVPMKVRNALQDILDLSLKNIPKLDGKIVVCPDVSGSMGSPITGSRGSATTKMRCIDIAALIAAALLKTNEDTMVLPFDTRLHTNSMNPRDSLATLTTTLAKYGGGGTYTALPLKYLVQQKIYPDVIVYISDNESWVTGPIRSFPSAATSTETMVAFTEIKRHNRKAKMVCIDLTPTTSVQAPSTQSEILNVGGFTDNVFDVIANFTKEGWSPDFWVRDIEKIEL